jgi:hypothetical protein
MRAGVAVAVHLPAVGREEAHGVAVYVERDLGSGTEAEEEAARRQECASGEGVGLRAARDVI